MEIKDIQQRLARPALKLIAGGFRPRGDDEESWLGNVFLFAPDEVVPTNDAGEQLLPYAQFYLPGLPFHCAALEGVRVLTLFMSDPFPEHFEPMGNNWLIREYSADDALVRKQLPVAHSFLKPFPLRAEVVPRDFLCGMAAAYLLIWRMKYSSWSEQARFKAITTWSPIPTNIRSVATRRFASRASTRARALSLCFKYRLTRK